MYTLMIISVMISGWDLSRSIDIRPANKKFEHITLEECQSAKKLLDTTTASSGLNYQCIKD